MKYIVVSGIKDTLKEGLNHAIGRPLHQLALSGLGVFFSRSLSKSKYGKNAYKQLKKKHEKAVDALHDKFDKKIHMTDNASKKANLRKLREKALVNLKKDYIKKLEALYKKVEKAKEKALDKFAKKAFERSKGKKSSARILVEQNPKLKYTVIKPPQRRNPSGMYDDRWDLL